jgi:hypothetical protein
VKKACLFSIPVNLIHHISFRCCSNVWWFKLIDDVNLW